MKLMLLAIIILLGFGLAGCGGSGSGVSVAPSQSKSNEATRTVTLEQDVQGHQLNGTTQDGNYEYAIVDVKMPSGRILTCLQDDATQDFPVSISCNWEAYNNRTP